MDLPLWVPWVLVVALAWPVALRKRSLTNSSTGDVVVMLLPALVMAGYAAWLTADAGSVDQDEFDAAASHATRTIGGNYGYIGADRVAVLMSARLGHDVVVESSDLVENEAGAEAGLTYTMTARLADGDGEADESGPVACFDVEAGAASPATPDLRLTTISKAACPPS